MVRRPIPCGTLGERLPMALRAIARRAQGEGAGRRRFLFFLQFGSGLTMALGRWLDAAAADDDGGDRGAAAGDGADRAPRARRSTCATPGSATSAPLALCAHC